MSSNICHIKYIHRSASNLSDKRVADMYTKNILPFDTELIAAGGHKVMAHRFLLSCLSKYLDKKLFELDIYETPQIDLTNMSHEVLRKVVELFYMREVFVQADLKRKMINALKFLKCHDINVLEEEFNKVANAVSVSQVGQHMSMETTSQHAVQPVAAKRKRAQSLYAERDPSNLALHPRQQTPNAVGMPKTSAVNISGLNLPGLSISKVSSVKKPVTQMPGNQIAMKNVQGQQLPSAIGMNRAIVQQTVPTDIPVVAGKNVKLLNRVGKAWVNDKSGTKDAPK